MSLPYQWRPDGTKRVYAADRLRPGNLVAFEHEVWRVLRLNQLDPANVKPGQPNIVVVMRRAGDDMLATSATGDLHLSGSGFDVYPDEHYPVCSICLKPTPCADVMQRRLVAQESARVRRYELPGVCPSCEQPVTDRQATQTWPDNLVVPNGQPVTFHLRERCSVTAVEYDELWRKAGNQSLLGFEPDAEAVERLLADLDGQTNWGRQGGQDQRRYASLIPPKVNLRPRACFAGCPNKLTHTGRANGVALMSGCESCVSKWVEDPNSFYDSMLARTSAVCPNAHLHIDGHLSPSQVRAGIKEDQCGCRRGVMRIRVEGA